jgi:hypothetical protein
VININPTGIYQLSLGWMSPKMIEKYSHVRAEAKRKAVRAFDESEDRKGPLNFHHIDILPFLKEGDSYRSG